MVELRGLLCPAVRHVLSPAPATTQLPGEKMNRCALVGVFVCGAVFALLASVLHQCWTTNVRLWWMGDTLYTSLGALPAGAHLQLMDDGYVTMALLGAHDEDHRVSNKQTTELEDKHAEVEALNTLKAAKELANAGKSARVGRLLQHAVTLAPRHPDILIHYGEYLEQHRNDVLEADKLYLRALAVSPANSRALRNRRRTQPLVEEMDTGILSRIDSKRDDLAKIPSTSAALRRIKKEAYYQYIYHTAGIEGNTMTLSQTRMILETRLSVGGKSVMEHNEILGLDLALKFINTTLVHRVGRITLYDILEIHRRVLGHVDPIEAGQLRTTQVYVSDHVPPPPTRLQVLMEDFVSWLNSPEAQNLHPIKYAALAHYKLVFIHPFSDGNGRTARLLMNFLLMQAGFPPVIIRKQDRLLYYDCLQTANEGDTRPFIRFIAHCTEKTLDVYLWATKEILPKIGQQNSNTEQRSQDRDAAFSEDGDSDTHRIPATPSTEDSQVHAAEHPQKKFLFAAVDENQWERMVEDDVVMVRDEEVSAMHDSEQDSRGHLWLHGSEEKVVVGGQSRLRRVVEEDLQDEVELVKYLSSGEPDRDGWPRRTD